jgi:hypothetical protein
MTFLKDADLIFLDPDNGLFTRNNTTSKNTVKYVLPKEVFDYYKAGHNVVFYCHKGRRTQDKWKEYFSIIDREFKTRGLFEKHESTLLIMKIDRMAFNISNLDVNDAWVKALLEDKRFKLPAKTRLLQALIKHPRLWRLLLKTKRRIFN